MDAPYTQASPESIEDGEVTTESATETDSDYHEDSLEADDFRAMTEAQRIVWRAERGKAKVTSEPEAVAALQKRKRVVDSPEPRKARTVAMLDDDDSGESSDALPKTQKVGIAAARKVVVNLDSDDEENADPVAAHMTLVRVNSILKSESEATSYLTTALRVMTDCNRALLSGSALDRVALMPVRQTLRGLLNLSDTMTTKEIRKAARALISLDRQMEQQIQAIVEALDTNVLVRDARHERFLREHKCPLCKKSFPDPTTRKLAVLRFNCDHAVHTACMTEWQRASTPADTSRCPFCRESAWGDDLDDDDMDALDSSDDDEGGSPSTDRAFRAKTSSEPATGVRVTRAMGRANERRGRSQYAEP